MMKNLLKTAYLLLLVTVIAVSSGCGRKGALVLPDDQQKPPATHDSATPAG